MEIKNYLPHSLPGTGSNPNVNTNKRIKRQIPQPPTTAPAKTSDTVTYTDYKHSPGTTDAGLYTPRSNNSNSNSNISLNDPAAVVSKVAASINTPTDPARLADIKKRIAEGTYHIPAAQVADAISSALGGE